MSTKPFSRKGSSRAFNPGHRPPLAKRVRLSAPTWSHPKILAPSSETTTSAPATAAVIFPPRWGNMIFLRLSA